MKRGQRGWSVSEESAIAVLGFLGAREVAQILGRTESGVRRKASRLGYSVKKKSEMSVTELSQAALDHLTKRAPGLVCPSCGLRLAGPSGVCAVCHKVALTDAHNERLAELAAHQEYNVAKQRLRRERRKLGVTAPGSHVRKEEPGTQTAP